MIIRHETSGDANYFQNGWIETTLKTIEGEHYTETSWDDNCPRKVWRWEQHSKGVRMRSTLGTVKIWTTPATIEDINYTQNEWRFWTINYTRNEWRCKLRPDRGKRITKLRTIEVIDYTVIITTTLLTSWNTEWVQYEIHLKWVKPSLDSTTLWICEDKHT